jgi:hypothetical protein
MHTAAGPAQVGTANHVSPTAPAWAATNTASSACYLLLPRDFGKQLDFYGQAVTVKCFENNPLVREVR